MIKYLNEPVLRKYEGKICLLRIDLNNISRLEAVVPTIKLLLKNGIKIVLLSHRGRPSFAKATAGKPHSVDKKLSLRSFVPILSRKLRKRVRFVSNFRFAIIKKEIVKSENGVFLLENLRFLPGEEKNDIKFARRLAGLGDFYVNDAFAVSHRKNASVVAITKFLPSYAGLLMEKEIKSLDAVMKNFKHPFTVIIGGAKISDKIGIIKHFWGSASRRKADYFLLGGSPANTFFMAQGLPVGDSLADRKTIPSIKKYLKNRKIILPSDVKIKRRRILDIGERTVLWYSTIIRKSRTVIWNGPMGMFEKKEFASGTKGIWQAVSKNKRAKIVVGGGETVASLARITRIHTDKNGLIRIKHPHKSAKISTNPRLFLSTGGGAMLEYLSGKKLPGIEALK